MPFDGVDYADALGLPKVLTHGQAPLVGQCYGGALRNAYFRERHHGQGAGTWTLPADFERRPRTAAEPIFRTKRDALLEVCTHSRWVPSHATHALCHVVFSGRIGEEGATARWQLGAGDTPAIILDLGPASDVPMTAESGGTPSGLAPLPGDSELLRYEAIVGVELANVAKDGMVHLRLLGGADAEDEAANRTAQGILLESFSWWTESVG